MKFAYSFRFKLSILYLLTIIVPTIIITIVMPFYYKQLIVRNSLSETDSALISMKRNIEMYLNDLEKLTIIPYLSEDVMNALKQKASPNSKDADMYTLLTSNRALYNTIFSYMKMTREDIVGTMIIANDDTMYARVVNSTETVDHYPYKTKEWFKKTIAGNGQVVFISPHPQDYLRNPPATAVFSVARLIKDPDTEAQVGFIMADADTNVMKKIISDIHLSPRSIISILDADNQPLYSTSDLSSEMLDQIAHEQTTVKGNKDSYFVIQKKLELANWKMVVLISNSGIQSQFIWVYVIGITFGIGGLIVTIIMFSSLSKWIIQPFRKMVNLMKMVQKGNFNAQMEIHGKDEIAQLGAALNSMISHLNELIDNEYRAQLKLRDTELNLRNAEYRSLQAQLQPHFIYNVLSGFIGLNRLGQKELLEYSIISLSKMLRYVLLDTDHSTIKDEFQFLISYCNLQKMRFSKKGFEFNIECDPSIENLPFPKLLLQPLVENSIIHGIEPINHACLLTVSAKRHTVGAEQFVEIIVEDNGAGFEQTSTESGTHIGLNNVQERLRLAFEDVSFSMFSEMDAGTRIVIRIPQQEMES